MLDVKARKVRRKCSIRGCKNTECYAISRTRELGGTVIICKACLRDATNLLLQTPKAVAEEYQVLNEENGFACSICGKTYKTEKGLKNHTENCSGGEL